MKNTSWEISAEIRYRGVTYATFLVLFSQRFVDFDKFNRKPIQFSLVRPSCPGCCGVATVQTHRYRSMSSRLSHCTLNINRRINDEHDENGSLLKRKNHIVNALTVSITPVFLSLPTNIKWKNPDRNKSVDDDGNSQPLLI